MPFCGMNSVYKSKSIEPIGEKSEPRECRMEKQDEISIGMRPSPRFWILCLQIAYWSLFRPFTLLRYIGLASPDRELGVEISHWQRVKEIASAQRVRRLLLAALLSSVFCTIAIVGCAGVSARIFGIDFDWGRCWLVLALSLLGIWTASFVIGATTDVTYGMISCVTLSIHLGVLSLPTS